MGRPTSSSATVSAAGSNAAAPLSSAESFIIPDQTLVTLPSAAAVTCSDGTPVSLPAGSQVFLRTGLPLPLLFEQNFTTDYNASEYVQAPFPVKDLDFSTGGAYSIYNWELFFHAPLLIAIHLSQNQQFQDAQNWFHSIFDPTDDSDGPTPARFWKVRPFQSTARQALEQSVANASQRYLYYQKLLGRSAAQINIPSMDQIDAGGLQNLRFSQSDVSAEPQIGTQEFTVDIAQNGPSLSDGEMKTLSSRDHGLHSAYSIHRSGRRRITEIGGRGEPPETDRQRTDGRVGETLFNPERVSDWMGKIPQCHHGRDDDGRIVFELAAATLSILGSAFARALVDQADSVFC
jgi:hypothetical protein